MTDHPTDGPSILTRTDNMLEAGAVVAMAGVTLLYTPAFSDNFLAKSVIAMMLSLWLGAIWWLRQGSTLSWVSSPVLIPFLLFLFQAAVCVVGARNPLRGVEVWLGYAGWLSLFLVGLHLGTDETRVRRLLRGILLTSLVVAAIGFLQYAGYHPLDLPPRYGGLPVSSLGNTNFVAHYLDVILPLATVILLSAAWVSRDRWLAGIVVLANGTLLVLTDSKGGWLSIGAALLAVIIVRLRARRWLRALALAALCVGLLSPVADVFLRSLPVDVEGRTAREAVGEIADDAWSAGVGAFEKPGYSTAMRLLIWRDGWRLARDQGLTGVGPGQWGTELPAYRTTTSHRDWYDLIYARRNQALYAHQDYLQEWGETGLPGMLALMAILGASLVTCWRVTRNTGVGDPARTQWANCLGYGGFAIFVAVSAHALLSFNLRDSVVTTHLWLIAGLVFGAGLPRRVYQLNRLPRYAGSVTFIALALAGSWLGIGALASDVHYARAMGYIHLNQGNRATLELRQAVAWRDHDYRAQHWLGKVSLEMDRPKEAWPALQRSLELFKHSAPANRLYANTAIELNRYPEAVTAAKTAIEVDPLTADNYQLLAIAQRGAGDPAAAATAWRQALSFRPDDVELLMALAQDLDTAGETQDAILVLQRTIKAAPRNGIAHGNLGALHLKLRQLADAEIHLRRAAQLDVANAGSWRANLVQTLMLQERWEPALLEVRAATSAHPEDERLRQLLRILEDR